MTSQDKVKCVYPDATVTCTRERWLNSYWIREKPGGALLGSSPYLESWAWADAWSGIQAARKDGGK